MHDKVAFTQHTGKVWRSIICVDVHACTHAAVRSVWSVICQSDLLLDVLPELVII